MSIEDLEEKVIKLGGKWGLYEQSIKRTRFDKFLEEAEELMDELFPHDESDVDINRAIMEAGDVLVTLIHIIKQDLGADIETCLCAAYNKIKDRTGKMVNGTYVKSEDLP
jgi:hypothetical protein